jgi:hypothetical protein
MAATEDIVAEDEGDGDHTNRFFHDKWTQTHIKNNRPRAPQSSSGRGRHSGRGPTPFAVCRARRHRPSKRDVREEMPSG